MRLSENDFAKNSFKIHYKPSSSADTIIHPELLGFAPGL
jgi:hypothetical protein